MNNTSTKDKEIKIPGPDHPITISRVGRKIPVTVAGAIVAESHQALRLKEKGYPPVYYLPRDFADMSLLARPSIPPTVHTRAIAANTASLSAVLNRKMPCGRTRDRMRL
jgi:uncharacterized protein (DUF427 family)